MYILNYEQRLELKEFRLHAPLGARGNRVASFST
jgi:hypothetical protein